MSVKIDIPLEELQKRKLMIGTPMYGGQCQGLYTKSIADLSALCAKNEIELRFYFLFNESLITRARNYVSDEFMRSDCTHLMFIDSDVGFDPNDVLAMLAMQSDDSDYDILCGPYPKKCMHSSTKIYTKAGMKTINDIVSNKFDGEILCLDSNNKPAWSKITNYWKSKNLTNKSWVSLQTQKTDINRKIKPKGEIIVTPDHEIAYIEDLFSDKIEIKYTRADNMQGKHLVQTIKSDNDKDGNNRHPLLNREQLSVLYGSAIGDGHIKSGYVANHGPNQLEYNKFKFDILGGKFNTTKNGSRHSILNAQTRALREILYPNGKKTLKNIVHLIDDISLAFMYMDDGNGGKSYSYGELIDNDKSWWTNVNDKTSIRCFSPPDNINWARGRKIEGDYVTPRCQIATHCFSEEDNNLLANHIKRKFDIDARVVNVKNGKYFYIDFDSENTNKFHNLISKYVHSSMEYKLNEQYRGGLKHTFNNKPLDISSKLVVAVNEYKCKTNSSLFDVEVENNHNLFINHGGVLVHNCISWEKVVTAVNKGYADEDPNQLEKFVGDYVFNPANGTTSFGIYEPVEVLESGTGFMMIKKSVFTKFAETYPQQLYTPDHVRTEHFDGSRQIMAYFDTPICKETNRYLSEDYMFCQWSRKAGMKVWLCPWIKLTHTGMMIFGGSLEDLAKIGESATADPSKVKRK